MIPGSLKESDIVVTGLGLVTPLGRDRESTWTHLLAGKTGIRDSDEGLLAPVAGFSPNGARSRVGEMALSAAREALAHAKLTPAAVSSLSIGCAVSQSKPILNADSRSGTLTPELLISSFSGWSVDSLIKGRLGLRGPSSQVVAACATGIASLDLACRWIRGGLCEAVLCGTAEASLHPLYQAGFSKMGVLARGPDPSAVCPFDRDRSGFALGEGAAVLIIETQSTARQRGVKPLARVLKICMSQETDDLLRGDVSGESIAAMIKNLIFPGVRVDYINAHGTGTKLNDAAEARGIRDAFKDSREQPLVSSTKAATGHLLGAAGATEAGLTVMMLRDQVIANTLHTQFIDPACEIHVVLRSPLNTLIRHALSLSYGFGGQMGGVLFEAV